MTDKTVDNESAAIGDRNNGIQVRIWLLLEADRRLLTAGSTTAVFVGFVLAIAVLDRRSPRNSQKATASTSSFRR